ncbi:hypothetical protein C2S53_007600 [Perilla frutescens var. hirtella]|uniref:Myb-like domain-containing protein n=1 Tax=Perilla frutescens var. hirtella TaxID=608512 RepID=A0AAD4JRD8_PERFH|nr:hypothetical protein C2S53_007600 [Perilla frutescens var. hirtella]
MEDQFGMADLRQYIDGRPFFPVISHPPDLLSCHRGLTPPHHPFDMLMFRSDSTVDIAPSAAVGFEVEAAGLIAAGDGGAGRWPRQETLTLLEIRSRLDPKFKEANQKGPLWDEVSRIMSEEHGYQRSGKKCREKFENLYKYYKKTKEGKAGRQDGKHYRFFRQLEAIYGETTNSPSSLSHFPTYNFDQDQPAPKIHSDNSVPDSCDCDTTTTSSYCSDSNVGILMDNKKKRRGKSFKAKIEQSIDAQMKSMMEKQEAWMEKMTMVIEAKERERVMREEQWRKQDAARIETEHKMWAAERAWIESRLMDAFNKLSDGVTPPPPALVRDNVHAWAESEVARLIQVRSGMDLRFQENGISEEAVWDEIAAKVGGGRDRSGLMCREKWDQIINEYIIKCSKKRKESNNNNNNSKSCVYSYYDQNNRDDQGVAGGVEGAVRLQGNSPPPAGDPVNDGFFRYFIGESYHQRL